MTQHRHKQQPAKHAGGGRPLKTRVFVFAVVFCCAIAGVVSLFDRKELPQALRENQYVLAAYKLRDKTLQKGEELMHANDAPAAEESKQLGYGNEDRKKLESLISKGAKGNDGQ